MINKKIYALILVISSFSFGACQKAANTNTSSNTNSNTSAQSNANDSTPASTPSTGQPAGNTPTDAYKAAHAARKNKDVEGLKKLFSKDVLEFLTIMAEADDKKKQTLDDIIKEMCEQPQAATAEARNEKINGDKATIEYLDQPGSWKTMDFVKEDGVWKLTIDRPEKGDLDDKKFDDKKDDKKK